MFRGLHLRLTLLYLLAALTLLALVAVGAYTLLTRYFQSTTDLALQVRMAQELRLMGVTPPLDLASAETAWNTSHNRQVTPSPTPVPHSASGEEGEGQDPPHPSSTASSEDSYDGDLAAIFTLQSSASQPQTNPNTMTPPLVMDQAAIAAALSQGSDFRTVQISDGTRVRLLTYRVQGSSGPSTLQLGRTLSDQDRVLNQLLIGLLVLGGISAILLGAGSWELAGRSLVPAQQAWERQQAFIANASHELRTPLTLMRASTEFAQRGLPVEDAERRELLGDVLHECDHMSRLVEDLLLLSRLDGGRLKLEHRSISLPDLLADVQRQVGHLADERGVRLTSDSRGGSVIGDPTRLRQVLIILLDNALRYTPRSGSIELHTRSQGRQIQISVTDTGSGIAPEHLPHVFERFYRADNTPGNDATGSGLGLAIARSLIEAQQGSISIESQVGAGTQVTLSLLAAS